MKKLNRQQDYQAEFAKLFNQLAFSGRHEASTVFADFLEIVISCFARGTMEGKYLSVIRRYSKQEVEVITKLFGLLLLQYPTGGSPADAGFNDFLGHFYEETIKSNQKAGILGQFFTPNEICVFMAQCTLSPEQANTKLRINDCACGSGRNLLAANAVAPGNYFFAEDIDPMCANLTTVNFILHQMQGQVCCLNSLALNSYRFGYEVTMVQIPTNEGLPVAVPLVRPIQESESYTLSVWKQQIQDRIQPTTASTIPDTTPNPTPPPPPKKGGKSAKKEIPQLSLF